MRFLLRYLVIFKTFWKIRHFFPGYTYAKSSRTYETIFQNINNLNSVLDFGCANGEKLDFFIKKKKTKYIYGIDINPKACEDNKKKYFLKKKIIYFKFEQYLTNESLKFFYLFSELKNIDLIIFSRVCCLLNDDEFNKIMTIVKYNCKYILIDDFFIHDSQKVFRNRYGPYKATNFSRILKNSFYLEYFDNSPLKKTDNLNVPKIALYRSKKFIN
jgi:hypothetical protein